MLSDRDKAVYINALAVSDFDAANKLTALWGLSQELLCEAADDCIAELDHLFKVSYANEN